MDKKSFFAALMGIVLLSSCADVKDTTEYVELSYGNILTEKESCWIGTDKSNVSGYYYVQDLNLAPFRLSHSFSDYGFGFGFTVCNMTDTQTPGYSNLSAIAGKGVEGDSYLTVSAGGNSYDLPAQLTFTDGQSYFAEDLYITNCTYTYLAVTKGDDGNGEYSFVKKDWNDEDFLELTITGYLDGKVTNAVKYMLAKGNDVTKDWDHISLKKLGKVDKLIFTMITSDMGQYGANTPLYFCLDKVRFSK